MIETKREMISGQYRPLWPVRDSQVWVILGTIEKTIFEKEDLKRYDHGATVRGREKSPTIPAIKDLFAEASSQSSLSR